MTLRATVFLCLCVATLAGCAGGPEQFVAPNAPVEAADVQRIYLATDRVLARDLSGTTERAVALSFAQDDITLPANHRPGEVESSASDPDPATSFSVAPAGALAYLSDLFRSVRRGAGPLGRPVDSAVV